MRSPPRSCSSLDERGIDMDKLNLDGGATRSAFIVGMTGAWIMSTLLNGNLESNDEQIGLETMCVAGAEATATARDRATTSRSRSTDGRWWTADGHAPRKAHAQRVTLLMLWPSVICRLPSRA